MTGAPREAASPACRELGSGTRVTVPEDDAWSRLGEAPGLCGTCRFVDLTTTTRGPVYVRCTRAAWDGRLARYPRLPVTACIGHERATSAARRGPASVAGDRSTNDG
jgi:hypothetical protein